MSKSQQLIDTKEVLYTTFTFLVSLFRSANKIDEDDAFVHLVLPPAPPLPRECKDLLFPWPSYMRQFTGPPPTLWPISGEGERGPVVGKSRPST
jgi:hypothetical protein